MDVSSPHRVPLIAAGKSLRPSAIHSNLANIHIAVYVYTAFYSPGMGPVPFVYVYSRRLSSQADPLVTRLNRTHSRIEKSACRLPYSKITSGQPSLV